MKNLPGYASAKVRGKPFHWTMSNKEAKGRMYNFQKKAEIRNYITEKLPTHPELKPENVENLEEVNVEKVRQMVRNYPGNVPIPRTSFNENILPIRPKKEEFEPIGVNLAAASPYTSGEWRANIRKNIRNRKPVSRSELEALLEEGSQNDFMLVAKYLANIDRKKGGTRRRRRSQHKRKH